MAGLRSLSDRGETRFGDRSYDVRGWEVRTTADDENVGKVADVLGDDGGRVRYFDLELNDGRHVLMPTGQARINSRDNQVEVPGMERRSFSAVPDYDRRPESVTPEYASSLSTAYDRAYTDDRFHERPDYRGSWGRGATDRDATGTLGRLDRLDDVKVADGEPDPRGWEVVGADGKRLGEVDHLIGDTGAMKVRYLTVELDSSVSSDREHVLVPVGHVDLDTGRHRVVTSALDTKRATAIPTYSGGDIDRKYETELTRHYNEAYRGDRQYEHPRYRADRVTEDGARIQRAEEELAIGKREHKAGEVDVRKTVETERVREPVTVHREEVEVERRPVNARARTDEISEGEVRIPVREEEVVVAKEPRVKEEIVVRKRDVEDTEMVEEDVRKERVEVEREGRTRGR